MIEEEGGESEIKDERKIGAIQGETEARRCDDEKVVQERRGSCRRQPIPPSLRYS